MRREAARVSGQPLRNSRRPPGHHPHKVGLTRRWCGSGHWHRENTGKLTQKVRNVQSQPGVDRGAEREKGEGRKRGSIQSAPPVSMVMAPEAGQNFLGGNKQQLSFISPGLPATLAACAVRAQKTQEGMWGLPGLSSVTCSQGQPGGG